MDYSSVMVFLDNSRASQLRLDFSLQFAAQRNAHLTGVHMSYGPLLAFDPYGQISGVALDWEMEVEKHQKKSREDFSRQAKNAGLNFDWDCYRDSELHQVLVRARVADICVVGQAASGGSDNEINRNFFSRFTINLGRPVLFLPYDKPCSPNFGNVVVGWDGGRESARAIADALPLLQAARVVSVMTIVSGKSQDQKLPDVDVAAYLARHRVNVELERVERNSSEAVDFILSRLELKSADLLVMGAYGHNRFSEFVLGGMTRAMLKRMTVPVLMSH